MEYKPRTGMEAEQLMLQHFFFKLRDVRTHAVPLASIQLDEYTDAIVSVVYLADADNKSFFFFFNVIIGNFKWYNF